MSKTVSLQVSQRAGVGRTALKAVRKSGRVPGVLYGKAKDKTVRSRPIEIDAKKLNSLLHSSTSENVLVDVELTDPSGKKVDQHLALLLDVQHHPIKDYIVHIDLHEIDQDEIPLSDGSIGLSRGCVVGVAAVRADADDRRIELSASHQRLQRRKDLLVGQITGGAKEDEGVRVRKLRHAALRQPEPLGWQ